MSTTLPDAATSPPALLAEPLRLPCGAVLKNRIAKAPLTEGLADEHNRATPRLARLYGRWADGGAGLLVTGNVQVDRRYLERPGNVVIDRGATESTEARAALEAYARAGTRHGTHLFMQINHPGRQSPRRICAEPVAPSAVPLNLPISAFAPPRAMTVPEILDTIARFVHVSMVARETGFTGVQVHAAHGYLASQFLTPLVNRRSDAWGGPLENRARFLLEIVRGIRRTCGADFPISIKLNSSDFQQGGFSNEECLQVVRWLGAATADLIEISGGNYERPSMMGAGVKESTIEREAYFIEYAAAIRAATQVPLMLTGGLRSKRAMQAALAAGACDVIGLGRPLCVDTDLPFKLLSGAVDAGVAYEDSITPAKAGLGWFCLQLIRIGDGLEPDRAMTGDAAIAGYLANETAAAERLVGHGA